MTAVDLPAAPRVLIAEADPWVRDMLTELVLEVRCDADLKVCADGQQAWEWLTHHRPDLVIADWELPGTDGLSLLRGVRQQRRQPEVAFILMSSRSDTASVREAVPLAPTAYLTKPLNMDGLRQRLTDLLVKGEPVACDAPVLSAGLSLSHFLDNRREIADGAPLSMDVKLAVKISQRKAGLDVALLEQALRLDPHVTAVLIAAANSAEQHQGKATQTLSQALQVLGSVQSVNLLLSLTAKRGATLTDETLIARAQQFWELSRGTAEYARALGRLLELDQERCFCAGLLSRLGDLSVLRCLQDWLLAGGELDEEAIDAALDEYAAAFGSDLRRRWRMPLELRELIAAVYQFSGGVHSREALAMNVAAQMALLRPEDGLDGLANSKPARLLKIGTSELGRLRKK
ncbi:HDOD domain-containing protein [Pseudomonas sp. NA-150]|uniref:HDOD domain-containing protein n=1 Tax=Pseudomonas sp. NA-150 TaxID=3367525 RepID=UPI0037CC1BAF